jgi:hypothetical protein
LSVVLIAVLLGYPAMACLIPGTAMTQAEHECCKQMAQQCGSTDMPSSHSCCQKEISQPNSMLAASAAQLILPVVTSTILSDPAQLHVAKSEVFSFELHPPPEGPPGTSSILRI